ncbi:hypothetical protein NRK68_34265 (plasmid) [Streptomyces yangpuensis]|uniref:DUF4145 domain-containing protein n=1 Tax=Streptomyces yangpuensis TaxID=1648182 RepID=A0ABY5Q789_9ACTN|nr:hypothetical protein [Streptomyces yangpuensis]UUY52342.1 hypothetical protein NRK68_34265 [Streptomyces yangpuensis]
MSSAARLVQHLSLLSYTSSGAIEGQHFRDNFSQQWRPNHGVERPRWGWRRISSPREQKALKKLSDDRNKLQHFGFTHDARVVESHAGEVLDFLIHFIDRQLVPYLGEQERTETQTALEGLREGLNSINSYIRERMNRIGGELKAEGVENRTVDCPDCEEMALVLRQSPAGADDWSDVATCRFCTRVWGTEELLTYFNTHGQEESSEWNTCPQCDRWALGSAVRVRSDPAKPVYFCFACATGFPTVVPCDQCTRPIDAKGDTGTVLCGLCLDVRGGRGPGRPVA